MILLCATPQTRRTHPLQRYWIRLHLNFFSPNGSSKISTFCSRVMKTLHHIFAQRYGYDLDLLFLLPTLKQKPTVYYYFFLCRWQSLISHHTLLHLNDIEHYIIHCFPSWSLTEVQALLFSLSLIIINIPPHSSTLPPYLPLICSYFSMTRFLLLFLKVSLQCSQRFHVYSHLSFLSCLFTNLARLASFPCFLINH